jgi:imidazolonepropionase-like amidohydrolase
MRHLVVSFLFICCLTKLVAAQAAARTANPTIAITHVTVIDPHSRSAKRDMTVVIRGGRISAVRRSRVREVIKGATTVDGAGKFLIPGLWDMHVHLGTSDFDRQQNLRLFIVNGITGIRIMNGAPPFHDWRREIEQGGLLGPRMVIASRIIAGPSSFASGAVKVNNADEARAAVRQTKSERADFIKVHDGLSRDAYFAIIDEARQFRLTVAGHVPESITAAEASSAGQKSIEHFTGLGEAEANPAKADALIPLFKKNHTWLCPTLIMRRNYAILDDPTLADDPRLRYQKASWKNSWLNMTKGAKDIDAKEWVARRATVDREKALIGRFHKAGVSLLAGTDISNPYVMPGFSLHDELVLLVESGLSPLAALRTATVNVAKFFGQTSVFGTIQTGRVADLVLLNANPLKGIQNTTQIQTVIVRGRVFDRRELDKMLNEIETAAR